MNNSASLEDLSAAVLAVAARRSVRDVLQTIVSTARSLLDCDYAALGVPDELGGFAEFVVDGVSDEEWDAIGPLPRQHGMLGVMLSDPTPQNLPDLRQDPRFGWWPAAHPRLGAFLGVPILDGEEILGAIFLANPHDRPRFTEPDQRLLSVLAAHAAVALTNARLYEQGRELTLVQERQRIARELHDAVAQKLFSLRLTAQAAATLVHRDPDRAVAELDEVARLASDAADELRQVVAELRPIELSQMGLAETLRRRVSLLDRVHTARLTFATGPLPQLAPDAEEAALRVAEEALHNALRHSGATEVAVSLAASDGIVRLAVTDNGAGFDPRAANGASNRLGLASMRARSRAVHGDLLLKSAPGRGTTVTLTVPAGGE